MPTDAAPSAPWAAVRRLGRLVLDGLLPPRCLACGIAVAEPGALCSGCWSRVRFLGPPECAVCGLPFDYPVGEDACCAACLRARPVFRRARAAVAYDAASRPLVLAFKHGDRTDAAPAFGAWMARAGRDLVAACEVVVPVPLHWTRLFGRRYNQAALLALAVARTAGLETVPDALVRRRHTAALGRRGPAARRRLLAGAIAINAGRADRLRGRRILLVDDVLTTGATAAACARPLLDAGAAAVDVLTLARVVHGPLSAAG